jgi:hypothetical protein
VRAAIPFQAAAQGLQAVAGPGRRPARARGDRCAPASSRGRADVAFRRHRRAVSVAAESTVSGRSANDASAWSAAPRCQAARELLPSHGRSVPRGTPSGVIDRARRACWPALSTRPGARPVAATRSFPWMVSGLEIRRCGPCSNRRTGWCHGSPRTYVLLSLRLIGRAEITRSRWPRTAKTTVSKRPPSVRPKQKYRASDAVRWRKRLAGAPSGLRSTMAPREHPE